MLGSLICCFLGALSLTSALNIWYITNLEQKVVNGSCQVDHKFLSPCISIQNLSDFLNNSLPDSVTNISLDFIDRKYQVNESVTLHFQALDKLIVGPRWNDMTPVALNCYYKAEISMIFENVSTIHFQFMQVRSCGWSLSLATSNEENFIINTQKTDFLRNVVNQINITNSIFDSSASIFYFLSFSSVSVTNSSFINNRLGLYVEAKEILIQNCYFENNTEGGAIVFAKNQSVTNFAVVNSLFLNNNKFGLAASNFHSINIHNSNFYNHYCYNKGLYTGSLLINSSKVYSSPNETCSSEIYISHCFFLNNTGGIVYLTPTFHCDISIDITDSNFWNNSAAHGGALRIYPQPKRNLNILQRFLLFFQELLFIIVQTFLKRIRDTSKGANVTISHCKFINNFGEVGGALNIQGADKVEIYNSTFVHNIAGGSINNIIPDVNSKGGAIAIVIPGNWTMLIDSCIFVNNMADEGGAMFAGSTDKKNLLIISNSNFTLNKAKNFGGAISAWNLTTTQHKLKFTNNRATKGGAVALFSTSAGIEDSQFMENEADVGGAIFCCLSSLLNVTNLTLVSNLATENGGGIALCMSSNISINGPQYFIDNRAAGKGGSVYIEDIKNDCRDNSCLFTWGKDAVIHHMNNTAEYGHLLYGGMVDRCQRIPHSVSLEKLWNFNFMINNNNRYPYAITSEVVIFCFYDFKETQCGSVREKNITMYPGQKYYLSVACLDQKKQSQTCDVQSEYKDTTKIMLGKGQSSRTIEGVANISYSAYTEKEKLGVLVLTSIMLCNTEEWSTLTVYVNINHNCPLGFEKQMEQCVCDRRLKKLFPRVSCDINTRILTTTGYEMFGYSQEHLRVYKFCPLNYCLTNKTTFCPSCFDSVCRNNRGGVLCGGCLANYSVVLGSWKCMECSHSSSYYNFIWLTVAMALAGVALVVFLLLVKMTVSSGTINGLIFYANILSFSGLLDHPVCAVHPFLRVFISWINLDLGIEVCFYSGMNVYQKTWLQFVFPFYIWFLVGVIILVCHYSVNATKLMGKRNMEVLATLFLLSYAKLLKTIITALSFTDILKARADNVSDNLSPERLWLYDGHIIFFQKKHTALFAVSLILLLVLFIPYTLFLTFAQCGYKLPKFSRSVYYTFVVVVVDVYQAPYQKRHRYWTGLGLLLRCFLFTIFGTSSNIQSRLLWIILAVIFVLVVRLLARSRIYKNKAVDILEIMFLLNLVLLAVALHHCNTLCLALNCSVAISLLLFLVILVYHVHMVIKANSAEYFHQIDKMRKKFVNKFIVPTKQSAVNAEDVGQQPANSTSYVELRETLIES